ncbi:MAG TPA: GAF domain-containing protein [Gaiellaceae bacterium]|nr:GAF domain-containing protein [Gaiellaceae bacterium]
MTDESALTLAAATARLEEVESISNLIGTTARTLVEVVNADACTISRAIGDLLIDLADYSSKGPVQAGHGYLISDYPLTRDVLEQLELRTVRVDDPGAEPNEVALLRQLGFDALVLAPLVVDGLAWGLVEVYTLGREPFSDAELARVTSIIETAQAKLASLSRAS